MLIIDRFADNVKKYPNLVAMQNENRHHTYWALDKISTALSSYIQYGLNINAGETIGIQINDVLDVASIILGALKAGCICAVFHNDYSDEALQSVIHHYHISYLVTDRDSVKMDVTKFLSSDIISKADESNLIADNRTGGGIVTFTSGTTGTPKPIALNIESAFNFMTYFSNKLRTLNINSLYMCTSPAFSMGLINILLSLCFNLKLYTSINKEYYKNIFFTLNQIGTNNCGAIMVPTSFVHLLDEQQLLRKKLPETLRLIFSGGERLRLSKLIADFFKTRKIVLFNNYGTTETLGIANYSVDYDSGYIGGDSIPVGKPIPNISISILDDNGVPVENNIIGKIGVQFDFNNVLTRSPTEVYFTNDLGLFDNNGNLIIKGRSDDYIKVRSYRINRTGVEVAIQQIESVLDVVVTVVEGATGDTKLVAAVTGEEHDTEKIRAELLKKLPSYMVPSKIIHLDTFPKNGSGKKDRAAIGEIIKNEF